MAFLDRFLKNLRGSKGTAAQRVGRAIARAEQEKSVSETAPHNTFPGQEPPAKRSWLDKFLRRKQAAVAKLAETGLRGEGVPAPGPFKPWQWGTKKPPEEIKSIGEDDVRDFIEGGQPMFFQSSNVFMAQYFPSENALTIETRAGRVYIVTNITPAEAITFVKATSKGTWTWNNIRGPAQRRAPSTPGIPGLKPATRIK